MVVLVLVDVHTSVSTLDHSLCLLKYQHYLGDWKQLVMALTVLLWLLMGFREVQPWKTCLMSFPSSCSFLLGVEFELVVFSRQYGL